MLKVAAHLLFVIVQLSKQSIVESSRDLMKK